MLLGSIVRAEQAKYQVLKIRNPIIPHAPPSPDYNIFSKLLTAFPVTKEPKLSQGYWGNVVGGQRRKRHRSNHYRKNITVVANM